MNHIIFKIILSNSSIILLRLVFIYLFISVSFECFGQSDTTAVNKNYYQNQIELRHDNDFLIFTDRYYTTGSYIEYRFLHKADISNSLKSQIEIGLEHLYYTPSELLSTNASEFDRPYAGYLGLKAGSFMAKDSYAIDFSLALGVTGRISGAEGFQKMFHSSGPSRVPPWTEQIKNNVHVNFYSGFIKEWELLPKPFAVYASLNPNVAFGTTHLYVENGFKFFFGKRNKLTQSLAYDQLGETKKEFFFAVNFAHRYVFHNALLEGYPIGDPSGFTINAVNEVFLYGINAYYRTKRNDFKFGYQYISKETDKADWHMYVMLSLARRF